MIAFQDTTLFDDKQVSHAFFGRKGGVSTGIFASLNCGLGTGDDPNAVQENRWRAADSIGAKAVLTAYQVHSADCMIITKPFEERPRIDSMVTDKPDIAIGVLTADCAPILFYGQKKNGDPVIGAAHAGWGGAFKGVLENTIDEMQGLDVQMKSVSAIIGPCIAQRSYEIGLEFYQRFIEQDEAHERFFLHGKDPEHFYFDLAAFCAQRLKEKGVGQIKISDMDTYAREADFFSYRRTTHRSEKDYGRQLSVIMIKNRG